MMKPGQTRDYLLRRLARDHADNPGALPARHVISVTSRRGLTIRDYAAKVGMAVTTLHDRVKAATVVRTCVQEWSAAFDGPPDAPFGEGVDGSS